MYLGKLLELHCFIMFGFFLEYFYSLKLKLSNRSAIIFKTFRSLILGSLNSNHGVLILYLVLVIFVRSIIHKCISIHGGISYACVVLKYFHHLSVDRQLIAKS